MVNIQKSIVSRFPKMKSLPETISNSLFSTIRKVVHEDDINKILDKYKNYGPFTFIDSVLDQFGFSYKSSSHQIENIPSTGRVIIIANHPLGAFDALSLIHLVMNYRSDIKVVANDFLNEIKPLESILIPTNSFKKKIAKSSIKLINESLNNEQALIVFPAGEVSRIRPTGVKDGHWNKGFLKFALQSHAPILPVHIKAKNSAMFYTVSSINKKASTLLLPNELFKQQNKHLEFDIGEIIPYSSFANSKIKLKQQVKLFKKHLYGIPNNAVIFETHKRIAHPEHRQELIKELKSCELLGTTGDNKLIYLYEPSKKSLLMREVGRLRELTFRKVEEGTGSKRDTDRYDEYYKHIILWDEKDLEIVGSYRIGISKDIYSSRGFKGFYCSRLFDFQEPFKQYMDQSIELGRSFIQPKYWGTRSLDYLWQGVGAYISKHPNVRYLFGAVSLSSAIAAEAQNLIVQYYKKHYSSDLNLVKPITPYISKMEVDSCNDRKEGLSGLKQQLKNYNVQLPTLFKQYTSLCTPKGVSFHGFDVDKDFNNCIDGFILLDLNELKPSKRKRYFRT